MQGYIFLVITGILGGVWAFPVKKLNKYQPEHWLLIFSFSGLLILPWIVVFGTFPNAYAILKSLDSKTILIGNICFMSWGIANILFSYCLKNIGISLTYGIFTSVGLPLGVLFPMIIKGSAEFSQIPSLMSLTGKLLIISVLLMICAAVLMAYAGQQRDKSSSKKGYNLLWILITVLVGILQVGMTFAFIYTQGPIMKAVNMTGNDNAYSSIIVWAITLPGGVFVSIIYCLFLLIRNNNFRVLLNSGDFFKVSISSVGIFLMIVFLGKGMKALGPLGPSLGFGIVQSLQILSSQAIGFLNKEWKNAKKHILLINLIALFLILGAIIMMTMAKKYM